VLFCKEIPASTILDATRCLFSFHKAICVWQKKEENSYQLYRNNDSIQYASTVPNLICNKLYNWLEEALNNIDISSEKRTIFSQTNPILGSWKNTIRDYKAFGSITSPEQRHSLVFGTENRIVIPASYLNESVKQYFDNIKQRPEKPTELIIRRDPWQDTGDICPTLVIAIGNGKSAFGSFILGEREIEDSLRDTLINEWLGMDDQRFSEKEKGTEKIIIPKNLLELKTQPKDETWRNLRLFAIATGIPVIARLPYSKRVLRVSPEGKTIKEFLDELVRIGFMYKWHQGVLLVCLQGWFHADREERKTPYDGVVYLRKVRKENIDGSLSRNNVFDLVQKFKPMQIYYLLPAIGSWADFLKSLKDDTTRYALIFSKEGLKVSETTPLMRQTMIRNLGESYLRTGYIRLREEEGENLESLAIGQKVIEKRFVLEKQEKAGEAFREIARIPFDRKKPQ
jgi:hypothetical protein